MATDRTPSDILDRLPPCNLEAEQAALGSILLLPAVLPKVAAILRGPDDFYDETHGTIYRHVLQIHADGLPLDVTILVDRLKNAGEYETIGGAGYIAEIADSVATAASAEYYAGIVSDKAARRRFLNVSIEMGRAAFNGEGTIDVIRAARNDLDAIQRTIDRQAARFEVHRPAELAAMDLSTAWYVNGVVARGQNGLVGGVYKSLKTSVTADLAISISTATPFLGKFDALEAASVLFMSAESGLRKLTTTCQRICADRGRDFAANQKLLIAPCVPILGVADDHDKLRRTITDNEVQVVFIDPGYRALSRIGNDAANLFKVGELLTILDEISEETGATIYVVHHCGKWTGQTFEPPELRNVSFAGFSEWARQWLLLGPRAEWTPETGQHRLWLSYGGSEGHSGCWGLDVTEGSIDDVGGQIWQAEVLTRDEVKQTADERKEAAKEKQAADKMDRDKQRVCNVLAGFLDGETKTTIRDRTGMNMPRVNVVVAALLNDGDVVTCEVTKGNRKTPMDGFKLK